MTSNLKGSKCNSTQITKTILSNDVDENRDKYITKEDISIINGHKKRNSSFLIDSYSKLYRSFKRKRPNCNTLPVSNCVDTSSLTQQPFQDLSNVHNINILHHKNPRKAAYFTLGRHANKKSLCYKRQNSYQLKPHYSFISKKNNYKYSIKNVLPQTKDITIRLKEMLETVPIDYKRSSLRFPLQLDNDKNTLQNHNMNKKMNESPNHVLDEIIRELRYWDCLNKLLPLSTTNKVQYLEICKAIFVSYQRLQTYRHKFSANIIDVGTPLAHQVNSLVTKPTSSADILVRNEIYGQSQKNSLEDKMKGKPNSANTSGSSYHEDSGLDNTYYYCKSLGGGSDSITTGTNTSSLTTNTEENCSSSSAYEEFTVPFLISSNDPVITNDSKHSTTKANIETVLDTVNYKPTNTSPNITTTPYNISSPNTNIIKTNDTVERRCLGRKNKKCKNNYRYSVMNPGDKNELIPSSYPRPLTVYEHNQDDLQIIPKVRKLKLNEIRIPLMWSERLHFKSYNVPPKSSNSACESWSAFLVIETINHVLESPLITDIDAKHTDLAFDTDEFILNAQEPDSFWVNIKLYGYHWSKKDKINPLLRRISMPNNTSNFDSNLINSQSMYTFDPEPIISHFLESYEGSNGVNKENVNYDKGPLPKNKRKGSVGTGLFDNKNNQKMGFFDSLTRSFWGRKSNFLKTKLLTNSKDACNLAIPKDEWAEKPQNIPNSKSADFGSVQSAARTEDTNILGKLNQILDHPYDSYSSIKFELLAISRLTFRDVHDSIQVGDLKLLRDEDTKNTLNLLSHFSFKLSYV